MKRHAALEPFSRDHNVGLILAREMTRNDPGVVEKAMAVWHDEMRDHFEMEEQLLTELASPESAERLVEEHRLYAAHIRQIEQGNVDDSVLREMGSLLETHIRWEEREFFPEIESRASEAQLREVSRASLEIENRRADSKWAPRRGELVARKKMMCDTESAARQGLTGPIWATETEDLDCTILQWNDGYEISAHVNDEVDVVMTVLQGSGSIEIDGVTLPLRAGVVVVITKGKTRKLIAESTPFVYVNVHKRRRRLMPGNVPPRR